MAHLITLTTSKFDPSKEPPNPPNFLWGQSILRWLSDAVLAGEYEPVDGEDWGWYMDVRHEGQLYLLGGGCLRDEDGAPARPAITWMIQVHKQRSFLDKLLGRNRLQPDDPLVRRIVAAVRAEPAFSDVTDEAGA